jgi:hypothetical protein
MASGQRRHNGVVVVKTIHRGAVLVAAAPAAAGFGRDALARIRTWDAGLRRAALYPLSYEGPRAF